MTDALLPHPIEPIAPKPKHRSTYLLMSQFERLEEWCQKVRIALALPLGAGPYLVGSALTKPDFRDVDLRVVLADDVFDSDWADIVRVRMMNRAMSIWGQQETGLPIDFQIQRRTEANAEFGGHTRNPMGGRRWSTLPTSGVPAP